MTERARNLAVGITVIVALCMLGGMILIFAGLPEMFQAGYDIKILTDSTHDVHAGDAINLAGMQVGRVTDLSFTGNDPRKGVTITGRVKSDVRIPSNVVCYIFSAGGFQGAYVELKPEGANAVNPKTGQAMEFLPNDQTTYLKAVAKGSGMIPQEVIDAVKGLSNLADNLNKMLAPAPAATQTAGTGPTTGEAPAAAPGLPGVLGKLERTLDAINAVMGDVENQKNIKASLANLNKATASATEAMEAIKTLSSQLGQDTHGLSQKLTEDAERVSQLMTTLNKAAVKLDAGEGSAGKLLNDPALYNQLVDAAKSIETLSKDFDALIKQWKERGVEMKLK